MKIGVAGILPGRLELLDQRLARRVAELGFTGVGLHLNADPTLATQEICQTARTILAEQGIRVIQLWGTYASLVSPDEATRQAGVRTAQEIVRVAADLGAAMVGLRPTSLNADGDWWPHPDNFSAIVEQRLVRSVADIASASETHGIDLSLECHVTTSLSNPKVVRRIIEATGSARVKVSLDPVNFVSDIFTAYHSTALINELFELLAPYIAVLHVKDVYVENRHVVHISETIPGNGVLDFDTLFTRYEALLPEGYALIEHLPDSQIAQAKAFVDGKLRELRIAVRA